MPPTAVAETRDIIGLALYYRKFIVIFGDVFRSHTDLMKKITPFKWSPLFQVTSDTIKITLTNSPILIFPDPNQPYVSLTYVTKHSWS